MLDEIPAPVNDIATEVIDGELLLYHPRQTRAVYLNPTAAVVWGLCDGHRTVREIVRMIGDTYPDAGANLSDDVVAVCRQLRDNGVMTIRRDA